MKRDLKICKTCKHNLTTDKHFSPDLLNVLEHTYKIDITNLSWCELVYYSQNWNDLPEIPEGVSDE